jgi:hypothetical protein
MSIRLFPGRVGHSQGGMTWAESPQSITLPKNQLLQLLAENVNGLDLNTCMQSSGYRTGSFNLRALSIQHHTRQEDGLTRRYDLDELDMGI